MAGFDLQAVVWQLPSVANHPPLASASGQYFGLTITLIWVLVI